MKILKNMILGSNPSIFKNNCLFMSGGNGKIVGFDIELEEVVKEIKIPFSYVQIRPVLDRLLVSGQGRYVLVDYDLMEIDEFTEIENKADVYLSSLLQNPDYSEAFTKDLSKIYIYKYPELKIISKYNDDSDGSLYYFENYRVVETGKENRRIEFSNYLTGSTLWQRSFEELAITRLDKFVGDVGEILVCVCDENLLLGLDKATGEIRWQIRHRSKVEETLINKENGNLYNIYGWEQGGTNVNLNLLEINVQTGEVLYDGDIFQHPQYEPVPNLGQNKDWMFPRFHLAVQWKSKIYFMVNLFWSSGLVHIFEFDTLKKRISQVSDELYGTTNSFFVAEGKLFITTSIAKRIETQDNPDPDYWARVVWKSVFNEPKEYVVISKEEYLTIIDLEDN